MVHSELPDEVEEAALPAQQLDHRRRSHLGRQPHPAIPSAATAGAAAMLAGALLPPLIQPRSRETDSFPALSFTIVSCWVVARRRPAPTLPMLRRMASVFDSAIPVARCSASTTARAGSALTSRSSRRGVRNAGRVSKGSSESSPPVLNRSEGIETVAVSAGAVIATSSGDTRPLKQPTPTR
eukprot:CAMPEP_0181247672 /NCGR_PEP_ID=MMETSP1096-20121128/44740_1 /TAXON_ID=156174 ORGANISM="Chrysochromulina ericina, Strain CCMP281" /NCGR_SAMPLE_ID=MMETSP1096 /ASSEMBLY_ACC=CAM_ASM_000453 /LENGTH=181 /DNA_ID=CAMNT_0023344747 /DNA_START=331 /DNA_END=878 /DNA_ORIENTATION=+